MPPEPVVVRRATADDLPALLRLLHRYFEEGEVAHAETLATLRAQLEPRPLGFYVAASLGGLVGCVLGRVLETVEDAAECKRLYVEPQFRGQGVATKLMDELETTARAAGFACMYLDSKDTFHAAMAMYKQRGYVECVRYNRNAQAAFFFRKRLW